MSQSAEPQSVQVKPRAVQIATIEVNALAEMGAEVADIKLGTDADWEVPDETEEQRAQRKAEQKERAAARELRQQQARAAFKAEIEDRLTQAFEAGRKLESDANSQSAWNARSIALYLVILAVVAMPFLAIIIGLDPASFGTYIAPITGIAGTVVGYWFGTNERQSTSGGSSTK